MNNETAYTRTIEFKVLALLAGTLVILLVVSVIMGLRVKRGDVSVPTGLASASFPKVEVLAKAAYVYDMRTKTVLYAKNENTRLPLASLTKVMSALVADEIGYEHGNITVNNLALETEGDSGLLNGERWRIRDLLDFSLITSSNDGMAALAIALGAVNHTNASPTEAVNDFVGEMNQKAAELGLKNTYYWNETGLDIEDVKGGAYGSARDMNTLMEYIAMNNPDLFSATRETSKLILSQDNFLHKATNTNIIASEIPGLLASKTGFTNTAGGNLTVIFDPELGRPFIITVLGSTERGRFEDMKILVDAVMNYMEQ